MKCPRCKKPMNKFGCLNARCSNFNRNRQRGGHFNRRVGVAAKADKAPVRRFEIGQIVKDESGEFCEIVAAYRLRDTPNIWRFVIQEIEEVVERLRGLQVISRLNSPSESRVCDKLVNNPYDVDKACNLHNWFWSGSVQHVSTQDLKSWGN